MHEACEDECVTEWLYGPDSMTWKINRESVLLLGGRAALLMQLAHPLVAAGVADHSDFQSDPVKRFRSTLDATYRVVFGDVETAHRAAAAIRKGHARVKGVTPDGRPYSADDPHLLLWVHSTLIDAAVRVYEAAVTRLSPEDSTAYYEETKVFAELMGIPNDLVPPTLADLRGAMEARIASGEVAVGDQARELAGPILRPLKLMPNALATRTALITAALLPPAIREGYGLRLRSTDRAVIAVGQRASRAVLPRMPQVVRSFPAARVAARLMSLSSPS
jgi:uncharacterized protein (DUF2236 family)